MQRWLFFLFMLCFACQKVPSAKTAASPMTPPEELGSLEQQLNDGMLALGLPPEPSLLPEATPPTTLTFNDSLRISPVEESKADRGKREGVFFKGRRYEKEAQKSEQTQCQRTCELVDNICDVAERICQLTEKLPGDPEAPKRCERAKNSCSRAQKQGESCGCNQ